MEAPHTRRATLGSRGVWSWTRAGSGPLGREGLGDRFCLVTKTSFGQTPQSGCRAQSSLPSGRRTWGPNRGNGGQRGRGAEHVAGGGGAGHSAAEPYVRPGPWGPVPAVLFADAVVITNWLAGQGSVSQALPSHRGEPRGMTASLRSSSTRFVLSLCGWL